MPGPRVTSELSCALLIVSDPATGTTSHVHKTASGAPNTQGVTPAEKIRYGQSIQEGGMGGKTNTVTGEAREEGRFWV